MMEKNRGGIVMVELDRLVKLLVEKMLRSSKKPEPSEKDASAVNAAKNNLQERTSEEETKDEIDEKMPEG